MILISTYLFDERKNAPEIIKKDKIREQIFQMNRYS